MAVIVAETMCQPVQFIRTSDFVGDYCVLSDYQESGPERAFDYVFLGRRQNGKLEPLLRLPGFRHEPDGRDVVIVSENQIVILRRTTVGSFAHFFVRKGSDGEHQLATGLFEGGHIGSNRAVVLGSYILGTVWVSPDLSSKPGNYLYVFSKGGLKFGRLPQLEEGYSIGKHSSNSFFLDRWNVYDKRTFRSIHRLPFTMSNGVWNLSFQNETLNDK